MSRFITALLAVKLVLTTLLAQASDFPGASGMAPLNERAYLCVQDAKDKPENLGADRFGALIVFTEEERAKYDGKLPKLSYTPLTWYYSQSIPAGTPFPSGLEAVCAIPGRELEYLACESGYWDGKYGRLFHLKVRAGQNETWSVEILRAIQLPQLSGEVEGIACAQSSTGRHLLILGEGGGAVPYWPGRLHFHWLDLPSGEMARVGSGPLQVGEYSAALPSFGYARQFVPMRSMLAHPLGRAISDLYLDPMGQLWAAAAADNGAAGPFTSYVYRLGLVDAEAGSLDSLPGVDPLWTVDGLRIKALCGPPGPATPGAVLSFATDDEGYGGVFRVLGPASGSGYSSFF